MQPILSVIKEKNMSEISKYYFKNFSLILDRDSYIVEVHPAVDDPPRRNHVEDLPDWVFHSKLAIWLTQNDAPVYERSVAGEIIKKVFISVRNERTSSSRTALLP
jgi:hypothetical protein